MDAAQGDHRCSRAQALYRAVSEQPPACRRRGPSRGAHNFEDKSADPSRGRRCYLATAQGNNRRGCTTRFVTQFPDSKSRKEAEARIAALTTPFDGKWTTVVSCRAAEGAGSFTILVEADVRGGLFNGEKGDRGKPGWYSLAGKVRPDGAVEVFARGIVPSSRLAAGNVPVGTPYGYAIKGRLEATKGTGARQGGRPCSVTFTKQ